MDSHQNEQTTSQSGTDQGKSRQQHHYPNAQRPRKQVTVKTIVPVHTDYVGSVIGKEGSTIKKIKSDTGANIRFLEENFSLGHQSPIFQITGSPQDVSSAERWIRSILQSTYQAEQEKNGGGASESTGDNQ